MKQGVCLFPSHCVSFAFLQESIYNTFNVNPTFVLPSCRASFMMDAPRGGSWLLLDRKKGRTCRQASSPGLKPSHISLKSRTLSSSRDMISVSFCFNISDRSRQTGPQAHFMPSRGNIVPPSTHTHSHVSLTSHLFGFGL